jgi:mannose-6-phosphate isomerase-like protein (cupin superfamily)
VAVVPRVEVKTFENPEETRPFEGKGMTQMVHLAGRPVARGTYEPGWRWSANVKPIAGTETCQMSHIGYVMQGKMRIHMDDGTDHDLTPGEVVAIPPGHDAEVIGNEPCVLLDFGEIEEYAKRR